MENLPDFTRQRRQKWKRETTVVPNLGKGGQSAGGGLSMQIDIRAMADVALLTSYEIIDSVELAARLKVRPGWIRKQTGAPADPLPHVKLGRYVRFFWDSPELNRWLLSRYRK